MPAPRQMEVPNGRRLHGLFVADYDNGEWFRATPLLRACIDILELTPPFEIPTPKNRTPRDLLIFGGVG